MSKDEDKKNHDPDFYPANYIEYGSNPRQSNRGISYQKILVVFAIFLLACFSYISLKPSTDLSKDIKKLKKDITDSCYELVKLVNNKQEKSEDICYRLHLINQRGQIIPKIDNKKISDIIKLEFDLNQNNKELQKIKNKLAKNSNLGKEENEQVDLVKVENQLKYNLDILKKIKQKFGDYTQNN